MSAHNTAEQNESGIDAADVLHVEGGKPLNGAIKVRGAKTLLVKQWLQLCLLLGNCVKECSRNQRCSRCF